MSSSNHAIVFGAAGLLGWATVEQLLSQHPHEGSFDKVTAVTNRPLTEPEFHWPISSDSCPELEIVSGVDLVKISAEDLAQQLRSKATNIENVTHVFYFVFKEVSDNHVLERQTNCHMMQRVVDAVTSTSPRLKSFIYPGGTRGYGIYIPGGTFQAPLEESMADNLPDDYAQTVAYPWFRRILAKASEGKSWTWTEICPDAVVGFTPNGSGWSLALHWAQYLSLYAHNHGVDRTSSDGVVEVPFPGSQGGFNSLFTPVSSEILGQIAIHASENPDKCGGMVINMADRAQPTAFREIWPAIAKWFGLNGVGPAAREDGMKPGAYVQKYKHIFELEACSRAVAAGVGAGSSQLDAVGYWLTFDRQLSLERLRSVGFGREQDPVEGWLAAFEKFRAAGIILQR
ncbi:Short chain dehydrogenase sirQ [Colletotrichum trifolii]|uniref:Short chain dehydrogenase sirQ n=1 Tax=Colletotrichum trifolii TaxID=5466 RepID=A0A4R8RC93_COLTR|nr:Short chain dehydrogenase sirQ [Colletotrichum trifolii]